MGQNPALRHGFVKTVAPTAADSWGLVVVVEDRVYARL